MKEDFIKNNPINKPFGYDMRQDKYHLVIIGDIHGCYDEYVNLINQCYETLDIKYGIKFILLGDLTDRGPYNIEVLATALPSEPFLKLQKEQETAFYTIIGNHDKKLIKYCLGSNVEIHDDQKWYLELDNNSKSIILECYKRCPTLFRIELWNKKHLYLAHGAFPEKYYITNNNPFISGQFFLDKKSQATCLYGHTTGNKTPEGFPERLHKPNIDPNSYAVFGHIVHEKDYSIIKNEPGITIYADHGCCFGGDLSAIIFSPEEEDYKIFSVKAKEAYKPLGIPMVKIC